MPWHIEERDGQYCVVKDAGGTEKCHASKQDALDHMAALYANVKDARVDTTMAAAPAKFTGQVRAWSGVIAIEDEVTGDGRVLAKGSARWENLPLPFRWDRQDEGGHYGAVLVGSVDKVWRDGTKIMGAGRMDVSPGSDGAEAARLIDGGFLRLVSVDPDDVTVEVIDRSITAEQLEAAQEAISLLLASAGEIDPGRDGGAVVYEYDSGQMVERWTSFRIRGVTLVDIAAFDTCSITLDATPTTDRVAASSGTVPMRLVLSHYDRVVASTVHPCDCGGTCGSCGSLIASGGALRLQLDAPAAAFTPPTFSRLTNMTVNDDRTFAGHIAPWGACHLGSPMNTCITPPRDPSGYAMFNRRPARTSDGVEVMVGPVTLGGLHVNGKLVAADAARVMEDSDAIAGYAVAGADAYGPWVRGALTPDVKGDRLQAFLGCEPSGDWRNVSGALHLVGVHWVPDPGFPVALVASGRTVRLVGAGAREMHMLRVRRENPEPITLTASSIEQAVDRALARIAARPDRARLAALAAERERRRLAALVR